MPSYKVLVEQIKKKTKIIEVEADDRDAAMSAAKSKAIFDENFNTATYSATYYARYVTEIFQKF